MRSRSHTLESSGDSHSTTPHSQASSKESPRPSADMEVGGGQRDGEVKVRGANEVVELGLEEAKRPKSPLVRMKRVVSDGVDMVVSASSKSSDGGVVEAGGGDGGKVSSPPSGTGSSGGRATSGEGEGEEAKRSSEVMINVIGAR